MRRKKKTPPPLEHLTAADLAQISATQEAPPDLGPVRGPLEGVLADEPTDLEEPPPTEPEAPEKPDKPPNDDAMQEALREARQQARRDGVHPQDEAANLSYTETAKRQVKLQPDPVPKDPPADD